MKVLKFLNKFYYLLIIFFIFIITFSLLKNPTLFFSSILDTLYIWLTKVFPSLFTFFIISSLIINFNILNKFHFLLKPLKKIFNFQTSDAFNIFILSFFNGNPSTTSFISENYKNNNITSKDANTLLECASFISPFFIISFFLNELKIAYILIFSHYFANIFICIVKNHKNKPLKKVNNSSYFFGLNRFLNSFKDFIIILLLIALMMCFCNILKFSIISLFNFDYLKILTSFLELSTGIGDILSLNISKIFLLPFISFLISFSGISIHLQVKALLFKKLKYSFFLKGRVIQGFLSSLFTIILIIIFF